MQRFEGKVVLITGAASGIGRAVVRRIAREGAALVLADRDREGLSQTAGSSGSKTVPLLYDAAQPGASADMAERAAEAFGGLDAVINIAGIYRRQHADRITAQHWAQMIQIDLTSVFEICQAALPALESRGGSIINTSSTAGLRGIAYAAHYAAAKAGILGLTQALAAEWAPRGIRANVVVPGRVQTSIASALPPLKDAPSMSRAHDPILPDLTEGVAPEGIAGLYAYLASEDARFVTGAIHVADGGAGLG
ncbi:SDR family NAD(P)-dependent oxidoreductase [Thalassorhabdomicrobium marinisediminis]|nr:SDR family NAD(P)-dependent oxidoreductase [Thalassorhabdomicrobium marinisediminis]